MGERTYEIGSRRRAILAEFGDNDDWGCLCTFPHNDQGTLGPERVRSLALLGAAVVLAQWDAGELDLDQGWGRLYAFLPDAVPQWIRDELMRILPPSDEEEWA